MTVNGDKIAVNGRLLRVDRPRAPCRPRNGWPGLQVGQFAASSYIVPEGQTRGRRHAGHGAFHHHGFDGLGPSGSGS